MPIKLPYVIELGDNDFVPSCTTLVNPKVRITVYLGDNNCSSNIIFDSKWIINSGWCEAMVALYKCAASHNIQMGTSDAVPLPYADIILFLNLPTCFSDVAQV
jgi:hypothetical protein